MATNDNKPSAPTSQRKRKPGRVGQIDEISTGKIFLVVLAFAALLVGLYIQVAKNLSETLKQSSASFPSASSDATNSIAGRLDAETLVVADNMDAGYLDHIIDALLKFGHKLSFTGSLTPQKVEQDLDRYNLIWMHDYPFQSIKKLHPHQRINHFPGTGFITNKLTLSTTPNLPHILKAFRLPHERDQFIKFAEAKQLASKDNEVLWIRKSSGHRGISIETLASILAGPQQAEDGSDILVQEYMANPLLVDGKKFDIGIYAVLTSVEPLRVYSYDSEALLRFCSQPYLEPSSKKFNGSNLDSYVVGDDYTPIWLMPALLRHYIGTSLSMKQTLNTYLKQLGNNEGGSKIWSQIEETIKHVYKSKEHHLARMSRMFQEANNYNGTSVEGSLNQFFEMVRFDFIVDDQFQVYLMEANMSPNLSSRHFPPNRLLYEQVLASYFNLVGLGQFARQHLTSGNLPIHHLDGRLELPAPSPQRPTAATNPVSQTYRYGLDELISEKELSVYEDLCVSDECHMNCDKIDCRVCHFCLSYPDKLQLRRAIFEQHSRWNFKRLLPSTRDQDLELQLRQPDQLISNKHQVDANYIHVQWFRGKCFSDVRFCSY